MSSRQNDIEVTHDFSWMEEDEGYLDPKELHQKSFLNDVYPTLEHKHFDMFNYNLFNVIGINETIVLCKLLSLERYYANNNKLQLDGSFYFTTEEGCKLLKCKKDKQRDTIDNLESLGLITKSKRSISGNVDSYPVRFIKINHSKVKEIWQ